MNPTQEHQVARDIESKSVSELNELLQRKLKLLADRSLLQTLPDKGAKVEQFVKKLQVLIEKKECSIGNTSEIQGASQNARNADVNNDAVTTDSIWHRNNLKDNEPTPNLHNNQSKTDADLTTSLAGPADAISASLQRLCIDSESGNWPKYNSSGNSYEIVMQKDSEVLRSESSKFMPNRCLRAKDLRDATSGDHKMKAHITEESAVYPPQYKHQKTKLISLNESIQLTIETQRRNEELAVQRATKKLLGPASTKMESYDPPATDMNYRQQNGSRDDLDSDDDDI